MCHLYNSHIFRKLQLKYSRTIFPDALESLKEEYSTAVVPESLKDKIKELKFGEPNLIRAKRSHQFKVTVAHTKE